MSNYTTKPRNRRNSIKNVEENIEIIKNDNVNSKIVEQRRKKARSVNVNKDYAKMKLFEGINQDQINNKQFKDRINQKTQKEINYQRDIANYKKFNELILSKKVLISELTADYCKILDQIYNQNDLRNQQMSQTNNITTSVHLKTQLLSDPNIKYRPKLEFPFENEKKLKRRKSQENDQISSHLKIKNLQNIELQLYTIAERDSENKNQTQIQNKNQSKLPNLILKRTTIMDLKKKSLNRGQDQLVFEQDFLFKDLNHKKLKHPIHFVYQQKFINYYMEFEVKIQTSNEFNEKIDNLADDIENLDQNDDIISEEEDIENNTKRKEDEEDIEHLSEAEIMHKLQIISEQELQEPDAVSRFTKDSLMKRICSLRMIKENKKQHYNVLKKKQDRIGMLYDVDPDVTRAKRKFRRNIRTIIYIGRRTKTLSTLSINKYIIKEDMRLKFLDVIQRLKLASVLQSKLLKVKIKEYRKFMQILQRDNSIKFIKSIHNLEIRLKSFFDYILSVVVEKHEQYLRYTSMYEEKFKKQLKYQFNMIFPEYSPTIHYDENFNNVFERLSKNDKKREDGTLIKDSNNEPCYVFKKVDVDPTLSRSSLFRSFQFNSDQTSKFKTQQNIKDVKEITSNIVSSNISVINENDRIDSPNSKMSLKVTEQIEKHKSRRLKALEKKSWSVESITKLKFDNQEKKQEQKAIKNLNKKLSLPNINKNKNENNDDDKNEENMASNQNDILKQRDKDSLNQNKIAKSSFLNIDRVKTLYKRKFC